MFLNSNLSEYFFAKYGTTTGMGTLRWKKYLIELLPIPVVDDSKEKSIIQLLDTLLISDSSDLKIIEQINHKIYELFDFTEDEKSFIEKMVQQGAH